MLSENAKHRREGRKFLKLDEVAAILAALPLLDRRVRRGERRKPMTPPTDTYTVTIADEHSHSVQIAGVPGSLSLPLNGKLQAALDAINGQLGGATNAAQFAALNPADTLTITVTQP